MGSDPQPAGLLSPRPAASQRSALTATVARRRCAQMIRPKGQVRQINLESIHLMDRVVMAAPTVAVLRIVHAICSSKSIAHVSSQQPSHCFMLFEQRTASSDSIVATFRQSAALCRSITCHHYIQCILQLRFRPVRPFMRCAAGIHTSYNTQAVKQNDPKREKKKRFAASGLVQGPYSASLDLSTTMLMDSNSSRKSRCSPPFLASFSPVAMAVYGAVLSALDRRVFSSVLPSCAAGWF